MGRAARGLQSALGGEAGVSAGSGWEEAKSGGGGGKGKSARGRGGAARERRGGGCERERWPPGRSLRCRCPLRCLRARRAAPPAGPRGAPSAPHGAEESGLGEPTLREEPGRSGRAQGPRSWRWGAEAPEGAPPRWATWRAPRGARESPLQSRCCRRPARCRCLSPVNWKRGSPWCW